MKLAKWINPYPVAAALRTKQATNSSLYALLGFGPDAPDCPKLEEDQ